jgi:tetratricopeptide (TPR) repeat protein
MMAIEPTGYFLCWSYYYYVLSCLQLWKSASSKEEIRTGKKRASTALRFFAEFRNNFQFSTCWYQIVHGRYLWLGGNHKKAKECWQEALTSGTNHDNLYEQGLAYLELGKHSSGEERRNNLQQAYKIFDKLESPYDLHRVKKEMEDKETT